MKILTTLICCNLLLFNILCAQETPKGATDGLELGIHGGHFFSSGNIDFKPGYGVGLHIRKSLDYVFSLRLDGMIGQLNGEDDGNLRNHSTDWVSGSLQGLVTLNNLKWNPNTRKTNIYALGGIGVNHFSGKVNIDGIESDVPENTQFHLEVGAGVAWKINNKMNIGVEHKVMILTNENADDIDGIKTLELEDRRFTFRDVPHYTNIRINFNLGKETEKTQPLYWLNPMEYVNNDLQLLKDTRVTLADDDGDGIINQLDEEADTPRDAPVNPKGVALDSDNDGIADYMDEEPYSPAAAKVNEKGVAEQVDVLAEVDRILEERLKDFSPKTVENAPVNSSGWGYLPSVFFDKNSATVRNKDLGVLADMARLIATNKGQKFVVSGHTDKSGGENYNINLSYDRAKAVVDFLVNAGVDRSQLILQYKGYEQPLFEGEAVVNRRVEFRVANGDSEMAAPSTMN